MDELTGPPKSSATPSKSALHAKWDAENGYREPEPRTFPQLKRAIKGHEERVRQASNKIEILQKNHTPIEEEFNVSIDNLKNELVTLVGSDSALALRDLLKPVVEGQERLNRDKEALERASAEASARSLARKWDYMDGHRNGGRIKKKNL